MTDNPPDVDQTWPLESDDSDLGLVWGLLTGSAPATPCGTQGTAHVCPASLAEKSTLAESAHEDAASVTDEEGNNQKELALSIDSLSPWQRIGRFPFALSSSSEASILCMTPFAYHDKLRAQLYDEDCNHICDTGAISMTDEDWVCLKYVASVGGADMPSSRLLSCTKECGAGWSVTFDVKELTDEGCISYAMRFVRIAKSHVPSARLNESVLSQRPATLRSSAGERFFDCTDAHAFDEDSISSSTMLPGMGVCTSMHDVLLRLSACSDANLPAWLLLPDYWNSISRGATVQGEGRQGQINIGKEELVRSSSALKQSGYSRLEGISWEDAGISLQAVALTMESLRHHGFPPVFIFMYDEPWLLFEKLFEAVAGILDCDAVDMDTSVFAWALRPVGENGSVGSNFGRPHRDCTWKACHTASGHPSALSVWMPLVPVTIDSGCMYVIPSDHDPLFDKSKDSRHMCPDQQMPWAHIQPLPCSAGDVLIWRGNLIHWGGSCGKNVLQPRKSIASTFRIQSQSNETQSGMLSRADLMAGLSMSARLKVIVEALLGYEHWHPGFSGLSGLKELLK